MVMILNIGCGRMPKKEGVINLDIKKLPEVDIVADARELPFGNEEIDKIISNDVIEHFENKEIVPLLNEWKRVLKIGGTMEIQTVDAGKTFDIWTDMPPGRLVGALCGAQKNKDDFHKMIFTEKSIREYFELAGLNIIRIKQFILRDIPRMKILCTKIA
jgi:predicted SAM-dependent methyltransferase